MSGTGTAKSCIDVLRTVWVFDATSETYTRSLFAAVMDSHYRDNVPYRGVILSAEEILEDPSVLTQDPIRVLVFSCPVSTVQAVLEQYLGDATILLTEAVTLDVWPPDYTKVPAERWNSMQKFLTTMTPSDANVFTNLVWNQYPEATSALFTVGRALLVPIVDLLSIQTGRFIWSDIPQNNSISYQYFVASNPFSAQSASQAVVRTGNVTVSTKLEVGTNTLQSFSAGVRDTESVDQITSAQVDSVQIFGSKSLPTDQRFAFDTEQNSSTIRASSTVKNASLSFFFSQKQLVPPLFKLFGNQEAFPDFNDVPTRLQGVVSGFTSGSFLSAEASIAGAPLFPATNRNLTTVKKPNANVQNRRGAPVFSNIIIRTKTLLDQAGSTSRWIPIPDIPGSFARSGMFYSPVSDEILFTEFFQVCMGC